VSRKIGYTVYGLIIGLVVRALLPIGQHVGLIMSMICGASGAWLGIYVRRSGNWRYGQPPEFLMALAWAVLMTGLYALICQMRVERVPNSL
jgi:uncharacterized membrane protein YeaQ/YmgE (transglycosylase-associated protein family)